MSKSKDLFRAVRDGDLELTTSLLDSNGTFYPSYSQEYDNLLKIAVEKNYTDIVKLLLTRGRFARKRRRTETTRSTLLHSAVRNGNLDIVSLLLSRGACVNDKNNFDETPLSIAVDYGHLQIVELLLKNHADVNATEKRHIMTLLNLACKRNFEEIADLLLKRGADINAKTDGQTPLHIAVKNESRNTTSLLLRQGARVDDVDEEGRTALYIAVKTGIFEIVETILRYRPDVNHPSNQASLKTAVLGSGSYFKKIYEALLDYGLLVNPKMAEDREFFLEAVRKGSYRIAGFLLKHGVRVNYDRDRIGKTPIFYSVTNGDLKMVRLLLSYGAFAYEDPELVLAAVRENNIDIVEALVRHGAHVNSEDKYGRTALHFTVFREYEAFSTINEDLFTFYHVNSIDVRVKMAEFLLSKGARVNEPTRFGVTTLHGSIMKEMDALTHLLLKFNANVNRADKKGITPLHLSAYNGNDDISSMLLKKGANVDAKTKTGTTALHASITRGFDSMVEILLKHNADINLIDENGDGPLHIAARTGKERIISMLLSQGADINKTESGDTALVLAVEYHHEQVVNLLLQSGADVNYRDKYGRTPLHLAAKEGYSRIASALLSFGACVNSTCEAGTTALHFSAQLGNKATVARLVEYGADTNSRREDSNTPLDCALEGKSGFFRGNVRFYDRDYDGTIDFLKQHQVKLLAAGLNCKKLGLSVIRCEEMLRHSFYSECQLELMRLKREFIESTSVSYYDILKKDKIFLAKCLKNGSVLLALESEDYTRKFPIYANVIKGQFRKALPRMKLLEPAMEVLRCLSGLPEVCNEKIMDHLSEEDLKVLIDCKV